MLKNYLRVALRNLFRNKSFSLINIAGLSVGMAAFLLIALFIRAEWSYENFHKKADRIYRLSPPEYARTAPLLSPTVKEDFPEIESAIRLKRFGGVVKQGEFSSTEGDIAFASQDILNMFSFQFLNGQAEGALKQPNTVIINESTALKYFNATNVVGKQLTYLDTIALEITGVYQDWPDNSHLQLNMIASFGTYKQMGMRLDTWSNNIYYTYALLQEKTDAELFKSKIPAFLDKHIRSLPNRQNYELVAQNLKEIHLHSSKDMEWTANGNARTVYIFAALALIILLIACINFMNLATAIATRRAKEIGVRKTVGAQFGQLVTQFLSESVVLSFVSLGIALLMVYLSLPFLNHLADKQLQFATIFQPRTASMLLGFTILVGLFAGFYPAVVLSSFRPLEVLRSKIRHGLKGIQLRRGLVLTQFALSLFLMIGSILVYQQLNFMKNQTLGFDKEQVLVLPYSWDGQVQEQYEVFKEQILQHPNVQFVTRSGDIPGRMATRMGYWAEGMPEDEARGMQALYVDKDFSEVYGLEIIAGRSMNNNIASDLETGYLLNEQAIAELGWTPEEAIGKRFESHNDGTVIGVVKDFHYNSLQQAVQPLFLLIRPDWAGYMSLRINTIEVEGLVGFLENKWTAIMGDRPFRHVFLDEDYNRLYLAETQMSKIVSLFTLLAIFIASIGLFGLTSFTLERRNKEIAVRKVLGASLGQLAVLLSKDFLKPILLAILVASPIAFWVGQKWLGNFAYQVNISPWWFLLAAVVLIGLAWIPLGFQTWKAGSVNPVRWLKEE